MSVEPPLDGLFEVVSTGKDTFVSEPPVTARGQIFGGHLVGQALVSATRTVRPDRAVHSLQSYFLRPGREDVPITYQVTVLREGRAFSMRQIVAVQAGTPILQVSASFHISEHGVEHTDTMPSAPPPETLRTLSERIAEDPDAWSAYFHGLRAFDVRYVIAPSERLREGPIRPAHAQVWLRATDRLGDDLQTHACALAYVSDLTLLSATLSSHGILATHDGLTMASLDHVVWFHQPCRVDEWLLYDQVSPSASGSRGLASGRIFTREGRLVASVMQEGLIRIRSTSVAESELLSVADE